MNSQRKHSELFRVCYVQKKKGVIHVHHPSFRRVTWPIVNQKGLKGCSHEPTQDPKPGVQPRHGDQWISCRNVAWGADWTSAECLTSFFLGTWSATFGFTLDELMIIDAHLDAHSDSQWTAVVCENTNGCSVVFLKTYGPRAEGNISRSKTEVAINGSTP